jgi:hypothetical protein
MAGSNNMPTEEEKEAERLKRLQAEEEIHIREREAKLREENQPKPNE